LNTGILIDDLNEIVKGCVAGKREFQEQLYKLFSPKMYPVCLYYTKDQTEAEDVLHDGFIRVFKYIGQFQGIGSFEGWLRRIMINTALERFRTQNHLFPVEDVFEYVDDRGYEDIISSISFDELLDIIRELTPQYRMVFNLYAFEDMTHKEISEKLGISVGTSKSNLSRARVILQEKIAKKYQIDKNLNKLVV